MSIEFSKHSVAYDKYSPFFENAGINNTNYTRNFEKIGITCKFILDTFKNAIKYKSSLPIILKSGINACIYAGFFMSMLKIW